jgi:hypothetical protein
MHTVLLSIVVTLLSTAPSRAAPQLEILPLRHQRGLIAAPVPARRWRDAAAPPVCADQGEFARLLNGYLRHRDILDGLNEYIQPPQLGGQAGVLGALVLAEKAAQTQADGGMRA